MDKINIFFEGCGHGDLSSIYQLIKSYKKPVDLVVICGDFQAIRNESDLQSLAVPDKFKRLGDFPQYYSGELIAPYLTLFIGGNHESSGYMKELRYGGWVAPNIYYLGDCGAVKYKGLRIAGLSGIWKEYDYDLPDDERPPFDNNTLRSVYHIRRSHTSKLAKLSSADIMLSHDWPQGIEVHGNLKKLLSFKKHFKKDIDRGELGSPPAMELLKLIKPPLWVSGHLHVRYTANYKHEDNAITKFWALDKCLPGRKCIDVYSVEPKSDSDLEYDAEWLAILRADFFKTSIDSELEWIKRNVADMIIPKEFAIECSPQYTGPPQFNDNSQTTKFLSKIGIHALESTK